MYHTVFMNVKGQKPVGSNCIPSPKAGFTGVLSWLYGSTEGSEGRRCDAAFSLGKKTWYKIQRSTLYQQRAGEAVYSPEGKKQLAEQVAYYMKNAAYIKEGLKSAGYTVSGGVNAPYIWLKAPNGMTSWEFFDYLLEKANVVGTPGSGFGPSGETYFRLTAFGTYENTVEAIERIKKL